MDEATATGLKESDRALQGMCLTLTADYVQEVLDHLEKIGPTPTIDSRKFVPRQDIVLLHYRQPFAKFATPSPVPKDTRSLVH